MGFFYLKNKTWRSRKNVLGQLSSIWRHVLAQTVQDVFGNLSCRQMWKKRCLKQVSKFTEIGQNLCCHFTLIEMKLTVMATSRYCSPKIKLLDFPIFILVIFFFFLIAGSTCGRWLGKIYPFLVEKKPLFL